MFTKQILSFHQLVSTYCIQFIISLLKKPQNNILFTKICVTFFLRNFSGVLNGGLLANKSGCV